MALRALVCLALAVFVANLALIEAENVTFPSEAQQHTKVRTKHPRFINRSFDAPTTIALDRFSPLKFL